MALKYVVKKRVFGFDKTKTEKYVAQNVITNTVNFRDLCKEVSMFGMIPEGAVKHVIDALIDALNTNLNKGLSVQLGDFGCFRPGMSCKSQKEEKDVDADTVRLQSPNQKIPDRKTKCVIETHLNIKQNVIFGANLKPV